MNGYLRSKGRKISKGKVRKALRETNPNTSRGRSNIAARSLNPKVYNASYFGEKLHIDKNEKLVLYDVTYVCARDGYSGMITAAAVMPIKNNLEIYEHMFR